MQSIEQRIERLERSAARWRAACLLTIVAVGTGFCVAAMTDPATRPTAEPPADGVIRGRSIMLRDGDGSPTVHIYSSQREAGMMVESIGPDGRSLVWLAAGGKEAGVGVSRSSPRVGRGNSVTLTAKDEEQSIVVNDKAGPRAVRTALPPATTRELRNLPS